MSGPGVYPCEGCGRPIVIDGGKRGPNNDVHFCRRCGGVAPLAR